jgi:hypothetical protein
LIKKGIFWKFFFSEQPGYIRETENDAVMERVDEQGNLLGFSVMQVSRLATEKPLVEDTGGDGALRGARKPRTTTPQLFRHRELSVTELVSPGAKLTG